MVQALVKYAINLARCPFNGEASETFTYRNEFRVGTNYTCTLQSRHHLGQAISPEDSVIYMEQIFEGTTFHEIINNRDIVTCMHGSMEEGNAVVTIARPGFIPNQDANKDHPVDDNHDKDLLTFVAKP